MSVTSTGQHVSVLGRSYVVGRTEGGELWLCEWFIPVFADDYDLKPRSQLVPIFGPHRDSPIYLINVGLQPYFKALKQARHEMAA